MMWLSREGLRCVPQVCVIAFILTIGASVWQLAFPQKAHAQGCCSCVYCINNTTCISVGCIYCNVSNCR
jgi:hypothetical protein